MSHRPSPSARRFHTRALDRHQQQLHWVVDRQTPAQTLAWAAICSAQPGLPAITASAPVSSRLRPCARRARPLARAGACCRRPRTRSTAPTRRARRSSSRESCRSELARLRAHALGVRQVAGVVVGGPERHRVSAAPARPASARSSVTSRTSAEKAAARSAPLRVVAQQVPVVLHRRAAAGRVDGDDVVALERLRSSAWRAPGRLGVVARVQLQRTAAARLAHGACDLEALRGEHPGGRLVHVGRRRPAARSPGAAPTRPRAVPRALKRDGSGRSAERSLVSGARPTSARSRGKRPNAWLRAAARSEAQPPRAGQQRRERAQPAGCGEGLEHEAPERAGRRASVGVALDLSPRVLDQLVVLHAGRAGGDAGHAPEAAVDVRDELGRHLGCRPRARRLHQHDPAARRVHLLVPQARRWGRSPGRSRSGRSRRSAPGCGGRTSSKAREPAIRCPPTNTPGAASGADRSAPSPAASARAGPGRARPRRRARRARGRVRRARRTARGASRSRSSPTAATAAVVVEAVELQARDARAPPGPRASPPSRSASSARPAPASACSAGDPDHHAARRNAAPSRWRAQASSSSSMTSARGRPGQGRAATRPARPPPRPRSARAPRPRPRPQRDVERTPSRGARGRGRRRRRASSSRLPVIDPQR